LGDRAIVGQLFFNPELKPWMRAAGLDILFWCIGLQPGVCLEGGWFPALIALFVCSGFAQSEYSNITIIVGLIAVINWGW